MDDCRHRGRVIGTVNDRGGYWVYITECVVCKILQEGHKGSIPKWLRVAIEDYDKAQVLNA